jgi:hypothetical protein
MVMKKFLILLLLIIPAFFMTASAAEVEEVDEQVVDEAYWYWEYNVKWTLCTINGEEFENIYFIWTDLGQTIVDEKGNALFMSEMNIERCEGVIEKIIYDDWVVIQERD